MSARGVWTHDGFAQTRRASWVVVRSVLVTLTLTFTICTPVGRALAEPAVRDPWPPERHTSQSDHFGTSPLDRYVFNNSGELVRPWDKFALGIAATALVLIVISLAWSFQLRRVVLKQTADLLEQNKRLNAEIAERTRAEESLRESEERFRQLADAAPVMIWMTDAANACIGVSRAWCTFTGRTPDKELGSGWLDGVHPDDLGSFSAAFTAAFEARESFRIEYRAMRHDGTFRWLLNVGVPRLNRTRDVLGFIGSCTDLTDRHQAELTLRDRTRDLERSNRDLERFAYVASHDLQEPLRMVTSFTQLLARKYRGKMDASADEFIGYAVEGATRMQRLIEDLLAYSRVSAHKPTPIAVPAEQCLNTALKNLQSAIERSGAIITRDELPAVLADPGQLALVLQNLIANAIKFTSTPPPLVHVSAEHGEQQWTLSVSDQGIGIDPKYFDRLFVMFQRLNSRDEFPGNGIGLSMCKTIVEQQNGTIWVESQPGRGSTFKFTLSRPPAPDGETSS